MRFFVILAAIFGVLYGFAGAQPEKTAEKQAKFVESALWLLDLFEETCLPPLGRDETFDIDNLRSEWISSPEEGDSTWNMIIENVGWYHLSFRMHKKDKEEFKVCSVGLMAPYGATEHETLQAQSDQIQDLVSEHPISVHLSLDNPGLIAHPDYVDSKIYAWPVAAENSDVLVMQFLLDISDERSAHVIATFPISWLQGNE